MSTTPTLPDDLPLRDPAMDEEPIRCALAVEDDGDEPAIDEAAYPPGDPSDEIYFGALNTHAWRSSKQEERRKEAEDDRDLVEHIRKGNRAAFRRLVDRYEHRGYSYALHMVRDPQDARDLVQETFLRIHRGLDAFRGESRFSTWFHRILTNLAIDLLRRAGRGLGTIYKDDVDQANGEDEVLPFVPVVGDGDPQVIIRRKEIEARIQAALDELSPAHRGAVLMQEIEGMSYEEIAQVMGVPRGTIMSRLFHARRKMQAALADCYAEENPGKRLGNRRRSTDEQ